MLLFKLSTMCCFCQVRLETLTQKQLIEVVAELEKTLEKSNDTEDAYSMLSLFLNIVGCVLGVCCCCFIAHESCMTPDVDSQTPSHRDPMIQ
jgi:hypothetical protein